MSPNASSTPDSVSALIFNKETYRPDTPSKTEANNDGRRGDGPRLATSDVPSEPYGSLPAGGMVCPLIESLSVASSPAPQNPGSVARFLSFIFPNLYKIRASAQNRDAWKLVQDLLPHMRQARAEGFVYGHAMALANIPPPEGERPKE